MALLTVQTWSSDPTNPTTPTYGAVAASDTVAIDSTGTYILIVKNASGTSDTVTVTDSGLTRGGSVATQRTFAVPITTGERHLRLDPNFVNQSTGVITITHTQTASVTCAVFRA